MNSLQEKTIKAIVNIFETSHILPQYGAIHVDVNEPGIISFGCIQFCLSAGSLYELLKRYLAKGERVVFSELLDFLERVRQRDITLAHDKLFISTLIASSIDPLMQEAQESFVTDMYWDPAMKRARYVNVSSPLACCIIYDSSVQGSFGKIAEVVQRDMRGLIATFKDEIVWMEKYCTTRKEWLYSRSNPLVRQSAYRPRELLNLVREQQWNLDLPLRIHGVTITKELLS